jgi:hypothetical protein
VVIVSEYRSFYTAMHASGELHRSPGKMTALARVLPPNVIAFTPQEGAAGIAKCLVVSVADVERAVSDRPPDHFLLARLVQDIGLIWVEDPAVGGWVRRRLEQARAGVLAWAGPFVEEPFDADSLGRCLLEVCYRSEFRPEARDRAAVVFESQRRHFTRSLLPELEAAAQQGTLAKGPDGFRFVAPPTAADRRRWRRHFIRSKARTTARWLKHVVTFDNWLPYVTRKVERRTGATIELTRLEKRWPVIFLWPRVIKVLTRRPEREGPR